MKPLDFRYISFVFIALQVLFFVLRMIGVIQWSWVWVVAPTFLALILALIFVLVFAVMCYAMAKGGM